ncbi:MAG: hypothetical protein FIB06_01635 [Betaproteobacteria bacterium]|nr:hypothetical protein [Betaproteobacteria bacterium]
MKNQNIDASTIGVNLHTIADLAARLIAEAPAECQDLAWAIKTMATTTAAEVDRLPGGLEWAPGSEGRVLPS